MHEFIYFGAKGRGEAIRVMLHAAGVEWKDNRFEVSEWAEIKPTTPLGAVPILKIDGNTYCQSLAMLRYAGKLAGFYPEDPLEALKVDQALDTVGEMMTNVPRSRDEEEFKKLRKEYQEGGMKKFMTFLESTIEGTGFASTPSVPLLMLPLVSLSTTFRTVSGLILTLTFSNNIPKSAWSSLEYLCSATVEAIHKNEKVMAYYASLEK